MTCDAHMSDGRRCTRPVRFTSAGYGLCAQHECLFHEYVEQAGMLAACDRIETGAPYHRQRDREPAMA
jgi:hypothetical protein